MIAILLTILALMTGAVNAATAGDALRPSAEPLKIQEADESAQQAHPAPTRALAESYVRQKRINDAISIYEKLSARNPKDMVVRGRLAELYAWSGNHDKSIVAYREALSRDGSNLLLKAGLATVLRWSNRYDEAERLYREILAETPGNHEALKGIAKTYALTGDYTRAIEKLDAALKLYPDDAELYKEKAVVLAWEKDYSRAIELLKKAVALRPKYVEAYRTMGDVYLWMKSMDQSVESYKRAIELEPESAESRIMLANAYMSFNRFAQAEEQVKAALSIDPSDAMAQKMLHDLREQGRVPVLKRLAEFAKLAGFILVLAVMLVISVGRKRMLKRRHSAYLYLLRYLLPVMVALNVALYAGKDYFAQRLDFGAASDVSEAILLFSIGLSFFAFFWAERRVKDISKEVILTVGAHPDDIELGCGGFILKAKDSGAFVYGLVMSAGEKGYHNPALRESEARRAAKFMELDGIWFESFPDTDLHNHVSAMKDAIERRIKETGATIVLTHTSIDVHSDHRAVFEAAKVAARNISILCYEDISTPREFVPNYYVDVTEYIGDKMRLVGLHSSQKEKNYMDPEVVRGRAAHRGIQCGVQYAEAFRLYKLLK